tara:strand:- start:3518 stop:3865 length:348 start_codon:yes stop_codon:yes gene_type:complete
MIILQETNAAQFIKFIPRDYVTTTTYNVSIISESENKNVHSQNVSGVFQNVKYYYQFGSNFDLKENNFYILEITDNSGSLIFKDKIFCTNQQVLDYTVNSGEYTTHSSTNEFIII